MIRRRVLSSPGVTFCLAFFCFTLLYCDSIMLRFWNIFSRVHTWSISFWKTAGIGIFFSLFFIFFFFPQGWKHHSKQPIYSDGFGSFLYTSKKVREMIQKEKRRKKILLSFHNCLFCYHTFSVLRCCKDNAIDLCGNEDPLKKNKMHFFF